MQRQVMGTPNYMSPEQWESAHDVGPSTDQWALGAILYELLAGEPAFDGTELGPVCAKITTQEPTPLSALRPDVPAEVEGAIMRALRKESDERHPSLFEFAHAISPHGTKSGRLCLRRIAGLLRPDVDVEALASGPHAAVPATAEQAQAPVAVPALAPAAPPAAPAQAPGAAVAPAAAPIAHPPQPAPWEIPDYGAPTEPRVPPALIVGLVVLLLLVAGAALVGLLVSGAEPPPTGPTDTATLETPEPTAPDEATSTEPSNEASTTGTASHDATAEPTSTPATRRPGRRPPASKPTTKPGSTSIFRSRQ